jgi:hypothetical protein
MSTRLAGHGLRAEGAAFTRDGRSFRRLFEPNGPGSALCECGALSEELPNRARRKAWHRAHKDEIRHSQPNLIRGGA